MPGLYPDLGRSKPRFAERIFGISWGLVLLLTIVACFGIAMLYSAADGNMQPWASKQTMRFAIALVPMIGAALLGIRNWFRLSYWTYLITLLLVLGVDLRGFVGMGARRWIDLGIIQLQPSELMMVALVLALARYFHQLGNEEDLKLRALFLPSMLTVLPVMLVLKQPDLGTAVMLLMCGGLMFFLAGVRLRFFLLTGGATGAVIPIVWRFLRDYQKSRIYTFLAPDNDPLGAGYHILQSKIALGSGGLFGKGFLSGTQSHLNFLPEKQTDFIFTTLAEEFGLMGALGLIGIYCIIIIYGLSISLSSRSHFGKYLGCGIITNFFLYVCINIAMVTGLIPVVGVPLPLISYGGTAMLTVMFGFGLLLSVCVDRDVRLSPAGEVQPG